MIDNLLILPLNGVTSSLRPDEFFLLTFTALFLPMFVATVGVFLSRRINLNIEVSGRVKLILPVLYVGLIWVLAVVAPTWIYYGEGFLLLTFIPSVPAVLGFLQAYFSYPDRARFYVVVFVFALIAWWSFFISGLWDEYPMGFGVGAVHIAPLLSISRIIGMIVLWGSPIAYFVFLGFTYRWAPDSKVFSKPVLMPSLLVTAIYSPLLFWLFMLLLALLP